MALCIIGMEIAVFIDENLYRNIRDEFEVQKEIFY
jgi:hypothetical protein